MRALLVVCVIAACGSPKPEPVTPKHEAAPPVVAKPELVDKAPATPELAKDSVPGPEPERVASGDPCEGGEVQGEGGLGLVGAGQGGGGTGESIGIGTIGHGSGTGSSGGYGGRRTANVPHVKLAEHTVKGDLDKAIVRRYVKRNINRLTYCYEKELLVDAKLAGKLVAKYTITAEGKVTDVSVKSSGLTKNVDGCVTTVLSQIEYPKPKSGTVTVSYPMTFMPQ